MSWRQSTVRDICHDCRQPITGPLWQGDHTPAVWCETCAGAALGKTLGDAQDVPRHLPVAGFGAFDVSAMKARLREAILARRGARDGKALGASNGE